MDSHLNDRDRATLESCLHLLARAGVRLADDVEHDDVEDAVADELIAFHAFPLTTVAGLTDPDEAPLLNGAVISAAPHAGGALPTAPANADDIAAIVARYAGALHADEYDVAVVPDPESGGASGSVRVRFGDWDVADIDYSFGADADSGNFELDVLAAVIPVGASAATFSTPDGRDVTLFIPAEAEEAAVDELFAAIEAEFAEVGA